MTGLFLCKNHSDFLNFQYHRIPTVTGDVQTLWPDNLHLNYVFVCQLRTVPQKRHCVAEQYGNGIGPLFLLSGTLKSKMHRSRTFWIITFIGTVAFLAVILSLSVFSRYLLTAVNAPASDIQETTVNGTLTSSAVPIGNHKNAGSSFGVQYGDSTTVENDFYVQPTSIRPNGLQTFSNPYSK